MSNAQQLVPLPQEPLLIYASREFDGYTYQLDPLSEARARQQHITGVRPQQMTRIFISYDMKEDFETLVGPFAPDLVKLLTGLSAEVVQQMGGVEFRDPGTDTALFTWPQAHS
jgi:hypothetical protein